MTSDSLSKFWLGERKQKQINYFCLKIAHEQTKKWSDAAQQTYQIVCRCRGAAKYISLLGPHWLP